MNNPDIFINKRDIRASKKLFLQIIEYVAFCYNCLVQDNLNGKVYRQSDHADTTSYDFEVWLVERFIEDYLQKLRNNFHHTEVKEIHYRPEIHKRFIHLDGKFHIDRIDICITNLNLGSQNYWANNEPENNYFAIECKRLRQQNKNKKLTLSNLGIDDYLTDIQKFVERKYEHVRFPSTGMIAFVEQNTISIDKIITYINKKLNPNNKTKQIQPNITTTQTLTSFPINNFQYCRLSKHKQSFPPHNLIEVYHLFFDYSNMIVP